MKKLTFISIALLALLSLNSCKKCAQCEITVTQKTTGSAPIVSKSTTELCGSDLKEADGNTTTSTATVMGYTSTITTKTECK